MQTSADQVSAKVADTYAHARPAIPSHKSCGSWGKWLLLTMVQLDSDACRHQGTNVTCCAGGLHQTLTRGLYPPSLPHALMCRPLGALSSLRGPKSACLCTPILGMMGWASHQLSWRLLPRCMPSSLISFAI